MKLIHKKRILFVSFIFALYVLSCFYLALSFLTLLLVGLRFKQIELYF